MRNEKYLNDKIKSITGGEVIKLFKDEFDVDMNYYNNDQIQYNDYENDNYHVQSKIDGYGGEGQGETYWTVSRVHDKRTGEVFFIKFDGYYESWNGCDFSNNVWSIVKPTEVKVVQWRI